MKILRWLMADDSGIENKIKSAEKNLDEAEKTYEETIATLDGENHWFLQNHPTLTDIDRKVDNAKDEIIRKVETTCSPTT
jgi:hypothetical protein